MNKAKINVDPPKNLFLQTLGELRKGEIASEASAQLSHLIKEARRTGKTAELNVKIKIRPSSGEAMEITAVPTPKVPKMDPKATTFFDTEEGGLQRDNPNQAEMFSVVDGGAEPTPVQRAVNG